MLIRANKNTTTSDGTTKRRSNRIFCVADRKNAPGKSYKLNFLRQILAEAAVGRIKRFNFPSRAATGNAEKLEPKGCI